MILLSGFLILFITVFFNSSQSGNAFAASRLLGGRICCLPGCLSQTYPLGGK